MAQGCDRRDEKAPGASEQANTTAATISTTTITTAAPSRAAARPAAFHPLAACHTPPRLTPRRCTLPTRHRHPTAPPVPSSTRRPFHVSPPATCQPWLLPRVTPPLPRGAGARGAHRGASAHRRALGALPRRIRPDSAELAASHAQGARRRFRPGMYRGIRRGCRRRVGRRRVPKGCAATCCRRYCCCCRRHRRCRRQV